MLLQQDLFSIGHNDKNSDKTDTLKRPQVAGSLFTWKLCSEQRALEALRMLEAAPLEASRSLQLSEEEEEEEGEEADSSPSFFTLAFRWEKGVTSGFFRSLRRSFFLTFWKRKGEDSVVRGLSVSVSV